MSLGFTPSSNYRLQQGRAITFCFPCVPADDPAPDAVFIAPQPAMHGISRLPDVEDDKEFKKKFKACLVGDFCIDIVEVQTVEGKLRLFFGISRKSKFIYAELD